MSMISTRHSVVPFVAGTTKAFESQRLAKVGYKSTAKNPAKFASIAVSVPTLDVADWTQEQMDRLAPHINAMAWKAQDDVIRNLYETSEGNLTSVSDDDISPAQILAYLDAEQTGDRLTKEKIVKWFDESLRDNLTVIICEKLQIQDTNDSRVAQHLAGYRGLFGSLSKDSGALQETQIRGLRKALEVTATDDEIGSKLATKLDGMLNRPKMEELLDL